MNISSRCEYGYRAVLELALHAQSDEPVIIETIAERRGIPEKFLVHILLQLKRAGIVRSVRGAKGGYMLAKSPDTITFLDIIEAIDGPIVTSPPAKDNGSSDFESAWHEITCNIGQILSETTIRKALDMASQNSMYYI
jgi:Rrf2 family transcriptional regulator, cysteine metabolism repressor